MSCITSTTALNFLPQTLYISQILRFLAEGNQLYIAEASF